ncbi:overexpressed in colon carcinoma 1 protein isoform X2 [Salmo trutta]|uniref:overexpressed in colon carcinoma 1 protein isoform X2 n=1 Tax=Salmo trutta TaxID=8032 RepID=UPI001130D8CB|nr:overexpressed in colon carcinoma 1 protein homolog isoform X2 [Salmo trutta]
MQNGLWQFLSRQHLRRGTCRNLQRFLQCLIQDQWGLTAAHCQPREERTDESSPDDEKRRNYGGVYVGLPSDMTTVAGSQSKSTDKRPEP